MVFKMQVQQSHACDYYPYSPVANASVGADSNNSSPESVYAEHRPFAVIPQQRGHQLMDLSSPLSAHHHHHHHHHHQQQQQMHARLQQNFQEQFYAHQELDTYDSGLANAGYVHQEQRPTWNQQPQQQPINRYPGYSSPPAAAAFVQQQQQHHHQVYAQPQLSPSDQSIANAHQTYSQPTAPFVAYADPTANFAQPIGKQQRAVNRAKTSNKRKRKTSDDDGVGAKIPKTEPTLEELDGQRITASMRERQRTEELNKAYSQLRQTIPCLPSDKLSKIQTVRLATKYIEFLFRVLQFNAMPAAVRHAHVGPKTAVLASALDIVESTKMSPQATPSHEKLSYAFSVWRMDNEMTGTTRVE